MSDNITIKNSADVFGVFPGYDLKHADCRAVQKKASVNEHKDKLTLEQLLEKKNLKITNKSIASTIITAGILGLILGKGFNGSAAKRISQQLIETGESSARHVTYYLRRGAAKVFKFFESIANITPVKDSLCDKVLLSNGVTAKFADGTRSLFSAAADRTLGKAYEKAGVLVYDAVSMLKQYSYANIMKLPASELNKPVTIKGITKTLAQWAEMLKSEADNLSSAFNEGFSLGARKARNAKRAEFFKGLRNKVYNTYFQNGGLFKASNYRGYMTDNLTKEAHAALDAEITAAERKVANNIASIYSRIKSMFSEAAKLIKPDDKKTLQTFRSIKEQLEAFKKCSGVHETAEREKITKSIIKNLDAAEALISDGQYTAKEKQTLIEKLKEIQCAAASSGEDSKGALERIMTILKGLNAVKTADGSGGIISDSEFKEFIKLSKKISSRLEKASKLEKEKYFIKQAEIEIGSAATDVLALIFPAGAGIYSMSKCKDNDERVSSALRTCIPLAGAFAMCIYGTVKMISGGKNLALSIASGLILNQLGTYADNFYRRYKKSGSAVKAAAGGYRKIISNFNAQKSSEKINKNV